MSKDLSNIDKIFNDSFNNWEAPHTRAEMNFGWNHISQNIPHANVPHTPSGGSSSVFTNPANLLKLLGIGGAAAVVTVAAVLTYNHYTSKTNPAPAKVNVIVQTKIPALPSEPKQPQGVTVNPQSITNNNKQVPATLPALHKNTGSVLSKKENNASYSKMPSQSIPNNQQITTSKANLSSIIQSASHQSANGYKQPTTDNQLSNSDIQPADSNICLGKTININFPANVTGAINWGDGVSNNENAHKYEKAGRYTIRASGSGFTYMRNINAGVVPIARFIESQYNTLVCHFKNYSLNAVNYVWDFGDGGFPEPGKDIEHTYHEDGEYHVNLIAVTAQGCIDSFSKTVNISSDKKFEVPNVITPNGNGVNDQLIVTIEGETLYSLQISDGNGHIVFATSDKTNSWDGTDGGKPCQAGTYFYLVKYQFAGDERPSQRTGTITLIR